MATTKFSIMNQASISLGADSITGDDGSTEYTTLDAFYDTTYEELLTHRPWTFAKFHGTFNLLSEESNLGYDYVYLIPNESVTILDLGEKADYRIVNNDRLHTDLESPLVTYIGKPDESQLPSDFISALVYMLASKAAIPLIESTSRGELSHKLGKQALQRAATNDSAQEPMPMVWRNNKIKSVRYGG